MSEITNEEKVKLGHEAFASFFAQFEPHDEWSVCLLEVLFEMLLTKRR